MAVSGRVETSPVKPYILRLAAFFLLLVLALVTGFRPLYLLLYVVVGLAALGYAWAWRMTRGLEVGIQALSLHPEVGKPISFRAVVHERMGIPRAGLRAGIVMDFADTSGTPRSLSPHDQVTLGDIGCMAASRSSHRRLRKDRSPRPLWTGHRRAGDRGDATDHRLPCDVASRLSQSQGQHRPRGRTLRRRRRGASTHAHNPGDGQGVPARGPNQQHPLAVGYPHRLPDGEAVLEGRVIGNLASSRPASRCAGRRGRTWHRGIRCDHRRVAGQTFRSGWSVGGAGVPGR